MGVFNRFCDMPRAPQTVYSMHGGAGGIMSIGLMRSVSFEFMERCIKSLYSTGRLPPLVCTGPMPKMQYPDSMWWNSMEAARATHGACRGTSHATPS